MNTKISAKINNAVKNRIFASRYLHPRAEQFSTQLSSLAYSNNILAIVFIKSFPLRIIENVNPRETVALPYIRDNYDTYASMDISDAIETCSTRPPNKALANMVEALVGAAHVDHNFNVYKEQNSRAWQEESVAHRIANILLDKAGVIQALLAKHPDPMESVMNERQRFHEIKAKRICDVVL